MISKIKKAVINESDEEDEILQEDEIQRILLQLKEARTELQEKAHLSLKAKKTPISNSDYKNKIIFLREYEVIA